MARMKQLLGSRRRVWQLGRRRHDVEGRGEASGGWASIGAGAGGHVARRGAEWGKLGLGKRSAKAAGSRVRAEQREGLEVEDRELSAIF
jgi:hypothetical protein